MKKYLLTLCLLIASLITQAEEVLNGQCGDNAFWTLEDSVLTISGTGPTYAYAAYQSTPWYNMRSNVKKVIISDGITSVGKNMFAYIGALEEVEIAGSVETLGDYSFYNCDNIKKMVFSEGIKNFNEYSFFTYSRSTSSITLPSTTEFIGNSAFMFPSLEEVICLASVVPKSGSDIPFSYVSFTVLYVPKESIDDYKADAHWSIFREILDLNSVNQPDTSTYEPPVYVDVYDTVHRQVDVYDTVYHPTYVYDTVRTQVLVHDSIELELHDYTVVFDTVYKTYKVRVNDYDTLTVYATDTIYTDTIYSDKYIHENIFVLDTVTGYIFEGDNPTGMPSIIQEDETVEIFSIDGHSAGHHRMDNMPGLSPGIYILRSLRTDNRLKIRVK